MMASVHNQGMEASRKMMDPREKQMVLIQQIGDDDDKGCNHHNQ